MWGVGWDDFEQNVIEGNVRLSVVQLQSQIAHPHLEKSGVHSFLTAFMEKTNAYFSENIG